MNNNSLVMQQMIKPKTWPLVIMILLAALSRLLPHPPNFAPVAAMAIFGGAYFFDKRLAYLVPFLAMWISDIILNNTLYAAYFDGFSWFGNLWVYAALFLITYITVLFLNTIKPTSLLLISLMGSVVFFLISNFGVWAYPTSIYPKTLAGLMICYEAAVPFFWNSVVGDLTYVAVLFGGYELLKARVPHAVVVAEQSS